MTCPFVFLPEHPDFRSTCERSVFRKGSRLERNFLGTPVDFTLVADPASLSLSLFSLLERNGENVRARASYIHTERKYRTRIEISFKKSSFRPSFFLPPRQRNRKITKDDTPRIVAGSFYFAYTFSTTMDNNE